MKFVFWCSNEQRQFRLPELDAIIHMLNLKVHEHWRIYSYFFARSICKFCVCDVCVFCTFIFFPSSKVEWLVRSSSLPWVALNLSSEQEAKAILERCPMLIKTKKRQNKNKGKGHPWKVSDLDKDKIITSTRPSQNMAFQIFISSGVFLSSSASRFGLKGTLLNVFIKIWNRS